MKKTAFFLFLVLFIFILDRYTKFLSSFVQGCFVFCIKRSVNYGAAFGLLSQFVWAISLLVAVALIVMFLAAFFYFKIKKFNYMHIGLALLFVGTLCNFIDRLFLGYVVDFLTFSFMPVPAFNFADVANVIGALLLIISLIKR